MGFHTAAHVPRHGPRAGLTWVLSIVGLVLDRACGAHPDLRAPDQEPAQDARGRAAAQEDPGQVPRQARPVLARGDAARDDGSLQEGRHQPVRVVPAAAHPDADLLRPVHGAERSATSTAAKAGVGLLNQQLADRSSASASLFGIAPLHHSIQSALAAEPGRGRRHRHRRRHGRPHDRVAVHHAAADHVEEPVARDEGEPDVPAAADPAVHPPAGVRVLGLRVPDRRDVLLADLELLDDGAAVHRHPEHADSRQRGRARA